MTVKTNDDFILKIVLISCYLLFVFGIINAHNSPATNFEFSIYSSTPIFVWISILACISLGTIISIYLIYKRKFDTILFYSSLLLVIITSLFVVSLYIIRGYYAWGLSADPGTHIHYIKDIVDTGHIHAILFYPILHVYSAEWIYIVGLNSIELSKYIPFIFSILFYLYFFILAKLVLSKKEQVLLSLLASCTLIYGWYLRLTPNHLSNLLFPLFVYLLIKDFTDKKTNWKILLLVFIFLYPPFHPISTLAFFIIAISFAPTYYLLTNGKYKYNKSTLFSFFLKIKKTFLLILVVWLLTWLSSFYVWEYTLRNLTSLLNENSASNLDSILNTIDYAGLYYNPYSHILKVYSPEIILYSFFIIGSILFTRKYLLNSNLYDNILSFYGSFVLFAFIMLIFLMTNVMSGPLRYICYINMILLLFFGLFSCISIEKALKLTNNIKKYLFAYAPLIVLLSLFLTGFFIFYPSPNTLEISDHSTLKEINGMNWTFSNRNFDMKIADISTVQFRLGEVLLNKSQISKHKVTKKYENVFRVPFHFGYNSSNASLSNNCESDYYLIISYKDRVLYKEIYPELAPYRWQISDFHKLKYDYNVWSVYCNGGYDVYYIKS